MARQLWLLRHADAEPHGTRPDFQRRLTERGERQARLAGLALARMGAQVGPVLTSPKERALRTATLALQAWNEQPGETGCHGELVVHHPLQHGFGARQALAAMADMGADGRLLMVGHEPDFSEVITELTGARVDLKKAGLAVVRLLPGLESDGGASPEGGLHGALDAPVSSDAAGELVLLLRPAELALIASVALAEV
ncbi:MAG TPA: histidine phosphatase family protein [Solirubrobacteraceae bacterium]|jgi:phosphohistidine phosphatase